MKKDIPKPSFVIAGKPEFEWTEEEREIYDEYLKAVKWLEEEREKYRKVGLPLISCYVMKRYWQGHGNNTSLRKTTQ